VTKSGSEEEKGKSGQTVYQEGGANRNVVLVSCRTRFERAAEGEAGVKSPRSRAASVGVRTEENTPEEKRHLEGARRNGAKGRTAIMGMTLREERLAPCSRGRFSPEGLQGGWLSSKRGIPEVERENRAG